MKTTEATQKIRVTIGIVIFPEFQLLDVAGPLDVLTGVEGVSVQLLAKNREPVAPDGFSNIAFTPDATLHSARPEVVLVPGGAGIRHLLSDDDALRDLAAIGERARYVTSVCTGALVLGAAGLLRGYRATTHWRYVDLLELVDATPSDERVVRDRNRITSGGVTAGIDFGLALVAELEGADAAMARQLAIQYDPQPPFNAGNPSVAPAEIAQAIRTRSRDQHDLRKMLLTR